MKIIFISNFISHHQQPFCNELVSNKNIEFYFISLAKLNEEKKNIGWRVQENDFEIKAYESNDMMSRAIHYVKNSDVIIISQSYVSQWIDICLENTNAIIFECGERFFKGRKYKILSPKGIKYRFKNYYLKKSDRRYVLCLSAYAASDLALCGLFFKKCFKWGYFPMTYNYDIDLILNKKSKKKILWVGRLLKWKHPETAIMLAKELKNNHIDFELEIIGTGPLRKDLDVLVSKYKLETYVKFLGSMSPEDVRTKMLSAGILLATSDSNEGWGAVINEAMNSACAVVASKAMGSVPFLIDSGCNGIVYDYKKNYIPYEEVISLLLDHQRQYSIAQNAYFTIQNQWNEKIAAQRFVELATSLLSDKNVEFENGPCSRDGILKR